MIAGLEAWATSWVGLLILSAIGVLVVGEVSAWLDRHRRGQRRRRANRRHAGRDPMGETKPTQALKDMIGLALEPPWYQACEADRKKEDNEAVRLQGRYHSCVARCIGVLSVGVVIICLSIIVYRDVGWLKKFATYFDLVATLYALVFFFLARIVNDRFVITRSFVETLRAWIHLAVVFPLERAGDVAAAYQAKKKEITARYWDGKGAAPPKDAGDNASRRHDRHEAPIYQRVEKCWTELHNECRAMGLRSPPSSADIGFYLNKRPLGQLGFFITAQGRINAGQRSREWLMTVLYIASVVLAVLKALSVFQAELPMAVMGHIDFTTAMSVDWISTALLVVMVLSAAATNAYVSRNERSLLHSYHAQERRIKKWFDGFAAAAGNGGGRYTPDAMLSFEDIMLNDLLDFIHITSRDVIEVPQLKSAARSPLPACRERESARRPLGACPSSRWIFGGESDSVQGMSKHYRPWKIDEARLLPPSVQDYVPKDHLSRFVVALVRESLDLSEIEASYNSHLGQPPFHPALMTALLLAGYASGLYSSRRIAKACIERADFMMIVAGDPPDFRTISDFRKRHLPALKQLFVQVLKLCEAAGLVKLGHVAFDGTKIKANASKHKAMSYERMKKREAELQAEVDRWLAAAEAADTEEDKLYGAKRGDELPEWIADKHKRLARIREAKAALEAEAKAAAEEEGGAGPRPRRSARPRAARGTGRLRRRPARSPTARRSATSPTLRAAS